MMKVNGIHVHAVDEKIEMLHYFRFASERLIFFILISISHMLGISIEKFVVNFIHLMNFSNALQPLSYFRNE